MNKGEGRMKKKTIYYFPITVVIAFVIFVNKVYAAKWAIIESEFDKDNDGSGDDVM